MGDLTRLTVTDVARHYGRRKALSQISFTCDAGEIVGRQMFRILKFKPDLEALLK